MEKKIKFWESFEETDSQIRELQRVDLCDEYFNSNYYDAIKKIHNYFKTTVCQDRATLVRYQRDVPQTAPLKLPAPVPPVRNAGEQSQMTPQQIHGFAQTPGTTIEQNPLQGLIKCQHALKTSACPVRNR